VRESHLGKEGSVSQGIKFLDQKFKFQSKNPTRSVFSHVTCCTDTGAMKVIVAGIMYVLLT
jgi:hypothetical protein